MSDSDKSSPRAKRAWERLKQWYGTRLTEQFGMTPPKDWAAVVDSTENEEVSRGLDFIRRTYTDWPPTFPQFEKALKPVQKVVSKGPTPAEQLTQFVLKHRRLTPRQLAGVPRWTFLGKEFDAMAPDGKMRERYGKEIVGVVIPADGDSPGFRIMIEDMQAEAA